MPASKLDRAVLPITPVRGENRHPDNDLQVGLQDFNPVRSRATF